MVDGCADQRSRRALQQLRTRRGKQAAGIGDSVRRLRRVATRTPERTRAVGILDEATGGAGECRTRDRSGATSGAELSRWTRTTGVERGSNGGTEASQPAGRRHALYDLARRVQDALVALLRPGRYFSRHVDRGSQSSRDREADRAVHQRGGPADGSVGRPNVFGVVEAS